MRQVYMTDGTYRFLPSSLTLRRLTKQAVRAKPVRLGQEYVGKVLLGISGKGPQRLTTPPARFRSQPRSIDHHRVRIGRAHLSPLGKLISKTTVTCSIGHRSG